MSSRFPEIWQITSYYVTGVLLQALSSCFYCAWVINGPRSMLTIQPDSALIQHNFGESSSLIRRYDVVCPDPRFAKPIFIRSSVSYTS